MKIGIIGAGQIGGTLTRRLTALGHEVLVANSRGPETLSALAAETGATAVSVPEAVRGVDLIGSPSPREISRACRLACSPMCQTAWSSSIQATTIRANATAVSTKLRRA
ncbi:MAG TPA: NAD(P)-binding domain-containing protein [Bradyrhizobium sp.]|nr:NAD(P)-binding domain-containing protein [Bradyrhizobium sp.]